MRALLVSLMLLFATTANAVHSENLRWTLTEPPNADGFRIYWALPGSPFTPVDVGRVSVNELNQFYHALEVPDSDVFIYVVAYNVVGDSLGSNQICRRSGVPCPPPDPDPDPEPDPEDPAHAEIIGFALWEAERDQMVMSNFVTGQSFTLGCYAIEVQVNKYLQDGKGSVRKYFDGVRDGCEQKYQFGWEDDTGKLNKWNCAQSLVAQGLHTLKAEAYDSTNCSGTPRNSVEVTFGVGVVPEPSFALGLFSGIGMLLWLGRRRGMRL